MFEMILEKVESKIQDFFQKTKKKTSIQKLFRPLPTKFLPPVGRGTVAPFLLGVVSKVLRLGGPWKARWGTIHIELDVMELALFWDTLDIP